jgi:hypothetical protein
MAFVHIQLRGVGQSIKNAKFDPDGVMLEATGQIINKSKPKSDYQILKHSTGSTHSHFIPLAL